METLAQSRTPTLARKMGDTVHISGLLLRAGRMSGCAEDRVGEWLLKCAVGRGASHYERDFPEDLPPDNLALSDEELGVALCMGHHPYNPTYIRAAAQLLSSPRIDARMLVRLAVMERVEPVLHYIAEVAKRFAPELEPWSYLRGHLRKRPIYHSDVFPHWSRFVSQTGVTGVTGLTVGPDIKWLLRRTQVK